MPPEPTHAVHEPPVSASSSPGTEAQLQKLIEVISRSQQGYRDLIDHLDQAVFTISLEGEIRVVNVRLCEILGTSFTGLIGHNLAEFLDDPSPSSIAAALPAFLKAGSWSGRISLRFAGSLSARTRAAIANELNEIPNPEAARTFALGLALGSPEFQRQ